MTIPHISEFKELSEALTRQATLDAEAAAAKERAEGFADEDALVEQVIGGGIATVTRAAAKQTAEKAAADRAAELATKAAAVHRARMGQLELAAVAQLSDVIRPERKRLFLECVEKLKALIAANETLIAFDNRAQHAAGIMHDRLAVPAVNLPAALWTKLLWSRREWLPGAMQTIEGNR